MSRDQRLEKVRDCFRRALSEADTERVLEMLENLERLDDVEQSMAVLGQAWGWQSSITSIFAKMTPPYPPLSQCHREAT